MSFNLKDKPLSIQIWIILGVILGSIAIIISIIIPIILRSSFTRETYARLEDAQEYLINYGNLEEELFDNYFSIPNENNRLNTPPFRIVRHTLITPEVMMEAGPLKIEAQGDKTQSYAMIVLGILALVGGVAFGKR
jgi:hypothetical protein